MGALLTSSVVQAQQAQPQDAQAAPVPPQGTILSPIVIKTPRNSFNFSGLNYLRHWALPNLFFHATTTYALLRHGGVEIGKADFLGPVPQL